MDAVDEALTAAGAAPGDVERFVHGMTVGTNALLEGRVARTALLATEGFTDLEELGRQARPELYRLCAGHPPPLVPAELRVPVPERAGPDGVLRPLDEDGLRAALEGLDVEAAAVCLLWGFRHPGARAARRGAARGGAAGRSRLDLARDRGRVPRVRALRHHDRRRRAVAAPARVPRAADRAGARRRAARARGDALEWRHRERGHRRPARARGPCCRARPAAPWARRAWHGARRGGARHGRHLVRRLADRGRRRRGGHRPRGRRPRARAADGGRAHRRRRRRLDRLARRGRRAARGSALGGRRPGSRVLRTRRRAARRSPTPTCCSATWTRTRRSRAACGSTARRRSARWASWREQLGLGLEETAAGIARVASAAMAQAVRVVTVERGIDPRELALVPFGGAGPLHAAQIADELGMRRVLVPVASGVLSAFGLVVAERRRDLVESVLLAGEELTARGDRPRWSSGSLSAVARSWSACAAAELRATLRPALRGPGFRAAGRRRPGARSARAACGVRPRPRGALRICGHRGRPRARERARGGGAAGRRAAPGRLGRAAGRRRRGARRGAPARLDARGAGGWRARAEDDVVVMERKRSSVAGQPATSDAP